jgi:hypothetical protein
MRRNVQFRQKNLLVELPHSLCRAIEQLAEDALIEPAGTTREGNRREPSVHRKNTRENTHAR